MNLLLTIKSIIPYLNGNYKDFGPKRMQNDRYLILLYGATMIDEFKQRGTKHGKLLYFSYNQLKKISNSPLFNPLGPLMFENSRTARHKVYPSLRAKKWVRIERINVESYNGAECVAITKKGTHIAIKRVNEIGNGFSMDANAWFHKGVALAKSKEYIESVNCYTTALQIDPNFATAWYRKGWTLKKLGKYDEAEQYFDKSRQLGYEG
jgi:tetratricopeptide (TPR) repeat protein